MSDDEGGEPLGAPLEEGYTKKVGQYHDDTTKFSDSAVNDFLDNLGCIEKVTLWSRDGGGTIYVGGIQTKYSKRENPSAKAMIGNEDDKNKHELILEPGEYITQVSGRSGAWLDTITIVTNRGNTMTAGTSAGGNPFVFNAGPNKAITGFYGGFGMFLQNLGVRIQKLDEGAECCASTCEETTQPLFETAPQADGEAEVLAKKAAAAGGPKGVALYMKQFLFYFMVASTVYALSTMIVAIIAYNSLAEATDEVVGILRNWSLSPIQQVTVVAKTDACPSGYEEAGNSWQIRTADISEQLGGTGWRGYEGLNSGCECFDARQVCKTTKKKDRNGRTYTVRECEWKNWHHKIHLGGCSSEQAKHGCRGVPRKLPRVSLPFFRGKRVCVQRGATMPALDRPLREEGKCPSDLPHDCQEGMAARPLCVLTASACPIFGVHMLAPNDAVPTGWTTVTASNGQVAYFEGNYKVAYTRTWQKAQEFRATLANSNVLPQFNTWNMPTPVVELGLSPCFSNPHVLGTERAYICDMSEHRWIEAGTPDTAREKALGLYDDALSGTQMGRFDSNNGILHNGARKRCSSNGGSGTCVHFKPTDSNKWRMAQMPEVLWKQKCVNEGLSRAMVNNRRNPVEDLVTFQLVLLIFCILNTVANLILLFMFYSNFYRDFDWSCFPGSGHEEYQAMEKFRKYLGLILKITVLPFCVIAYVISDEVRHFFLDVSSLGCSDPKTNATVSKLADGIQDAFENNKAAMIMTGVVFAIELVLILVSWCRGGLFGENAEAEKEKEEALKPDTPEAPDLPAPLGPPCDIISVVDLSDTMPFFGMQKQRAAEKRDQDRIDGVPGHEEFPEPVSFEDIAEPRKTRILAVQFYEQPMDGTMKFGAKITKRMVGLQVTFENEQTRADQVRPRQFPKKLENRIREGVNMGTAPAELVRTLSAPVEGKSITLLPHEYLVSVEGCYDKVDGTVYEITATTNLGNSVTAGARPLNHFLETNIDNFDMKGRPDKPAIVGFMTQISTLFGIVGMAFPLGAMPALAAQMEASGDTEGGDATIIVQPGLGTAANIVPQPGGNIVPQPGMSPDGASIVPQPGSSADGVEMTIVAQPGAT
ncbi:unnamed protein product [Amoebophrya sp. A25]|nr:unnamed protein product [Amoebophrya sp. A25]|eukprot:GSA25T00004661001.1